MCVWIATIDVLYCGLDLICISSNEVVSSVCLFKDTMFVEFRTFTGYLIATCVYMLVKGCDSKFEVKVIAFFVNVQVA